MNATSELLLEVDDLRTYFSTRTGVVKAVDGVSFGIRPKETLGLVGESGCGKSTVALSIMRLVDYPGRIVKGKIFLKGENLLEKTEEEMTKIRGKEIAMIMQDPMTALDPVFTVGDQTTEALTWHKKLARVEARQTALQLFAEVGIPSPGDRVNDYPHHFSGGMRQRVVIAIALSCAPCLLIADEPTTNLDVTIQAQILEYMKTLRMKFDTSILLVTHHLGIVAEMCDRVAVMYCGDLVECSDTSSLFRETRHPYTHGLLRCLPRREHKRLPTIEGSVPDLISPPRGCKFHPRCPKAVPRCREEKPPLMETEPGVFLACHLYR
jgi:oligopeptide/dipeptide ABC transporter ATP-binding protein